MLQASRRRSRPTAAAASATDSQARRRVATPVRSQIAARTRPEAMSVAATSTTDEPDEAVLELGHHRRRRVAGRSLPPAAVDGRDEAQDPRAHRRAERQDGRRRWVLGDRGHGGGQRDGEAGVQQVSQSPAASQLGRVDPAAVALPEDDGDNRRQRRDDPAQHAGRAPWPRPGRSPASAAGVRAGARRSAGRLRRA